MSQGINNVTLLGNLTRDPELRPLPSGSQVCEIGLAVNGREKRGDTWEDRPDFFEVVVFGKQAEHCAAYLAKGRQVAIVGRVKQDRWTTDAGESRSKVRIVADVVRFLGAREDAPAKLEQPVQPTAPTNADDDIPF